MTELTYLALATLFFYLLTAIDVIRGNRLIRNLDSIVPVLNCPARKVSIIAAARNEERNLRQAISSLLALDYPELELIIVNDRSEDSTGVILTELAAGDTRLQVVTVKELPPGWLGKNHALWLGSQRASGELLLFTDADIIMEPTLLKRAVAYMTEKKLDHLVVSPRIVMPGHLLPMFALTFMLFFAMFTRPWKARDPKSRAHIGIGAFNLVNAASYVACGGHETIRLRPDDDLKLGKLLKKNGFAQDIAAGPQFMEVEWYSTVGDVIRGLEKNAYAGCDYRIWLALGGVTLHSLFSIWPFAALFLTSGLTQLTYLLVVATITLILLNCADANHASRWYVIGFPLAAALFVWIVIRTTTLNLWQGGITWRGTFYPLSELTKNRV